MREDEKDVDVEKLGGGEVEVRGEEVGGVEEVVSSSQGERGAKEKMEVKGGADKVGKEGEGEEVGEEEKEEVEKEVKDEVEEVMGEEKGEVEKEGKVKVEKVLEEVRGEVEKVEKEAREERVRETQEVQMADQHLNWLRDSAQVRMSPKTTRLSKCQQVTQPLDCTIGGGETGPDIGGVSVPDGQSGGGSEQLAEDYAGT